MKKIMFNDKFGLTQAVFGRAEDYDEKNNQMSKNF